MDSTLTDLSIEYWDALMEANPSAATMLGDHRFDDQIEDYSEESLDSFASKMASIIDRANAIDPASLTRADQVTRAMMLWGATNFGELVEIRSMELDSNQMNGPHASFLAMLPNLNVPEPEYAEAIVDRFGKVDQMLGTATDRFRDGLAKGRTPARINIERSIHQIDEYLATPIDQDRIVNLQGPDEWDGEDEWREQLKEAVRDTVRPAFERYRAMLADELLPAGRPNDRPGLTWIDDGEELYAAQARYYTTVELGPEELHEIGRETIEKQLPEEYSMVGEKALGISDPAAVLERLRTDPTVRFSTGEEMLEVATASLERATASMGDWFGRLPKAPCRIEVVPEYLAQDVPRAYYYPPADDGSRPGTHFVNLHAPEDQNRYDAEAVAFHESIPGHHLQIAIAAELEDVPIFQRHALTSAHAEGWGLYSERLADEMGLYSSDLDRLGMLSGDSWRAGRLVVDTGLHTMGWTRQQAIDYLVVNTAVSLGDIEVEVDRYIGIPGQALAYKTGEREIMRLRHDAERELEDQFDIKAFHDVVLTNGAITLDVLGQLVDDWTQSVQAA